MVDKSITDELTSEDFVRAIADLMRPWKVPEGAALEAVRREIKDPWYKRTDSPEMGFRSENKQDAEDLVDALNVVERVTAKSTFIASLVQSSQEFHSEQEALTETAEWELEDLDRLWIKKNKEEAAEQLVPLRQRATRLKKQCQKIIANPPGEDPRSGYRQRDVACGALLLWLEHSTKRPTVDYNSEFCRFASLLWEAITDDPRNMEYACRKLLGWLR
jgi:hypothetical protein